MQLAIARPDNGAPPMLGSGLSGTLMMSPAIRVLEVVEPAVLVAGGIFRVPRVEKSWFSSQHVSRWLACRMVPGMLEVVPGAFDSDRG